jgi:DNA-binding response OmpR family regulator
VLVVVDEVKLASLIRRGLREEGLLADVAINGEGALWMAAATAYEKLDRPFGVETIETVRGAGYRMKGV